MSIIATSPSATQETGDLGREIEYRQCIGRQLYIKMYIIQYKFLTAIFGFVRKNFSAEMLIREIRARCGKASFVSR
jgi:hypothetical protein